MNYIELKIYTSSQGVEAVSQALLERGIDQISVDDPADFVGILNKEEDFEWDYIDDALMENNDREPVVSAYFDVTEDGRAKAEEIKAAVAQLKADQEAGFYGPAADFGRMHIEEIVVNDEDWKYKWKEFFKPTKVTERIVVKPTWEEYEAADDELILEIDPGMAFGTGTHETTSLCMKLLEKYITGSDMAAEDISVLDVGCGSGILAISAALLGCKDILGVEIDQEAVDIAIENVELNNTADSVRVQQGDLTKGIDFEADIIVANLMHNLVIMLSPSARKHVKKDGIYISSGILVEKRELVREAVEAAGFEILEIPVDGDWCAIAAKAK